MYRDNTPTYNAGNRKLVNFNGFDKEEEEKELRDIQKSQIKTNHPITQSQEHRRKNRWNKVTHKIEDLHPSEVDDKLEDLEEVEEKIVIKKFNEYLDPMGSWEGPNSEEEEEEEECDIDLNSCESILKEIMEISSFENQESADDMQINLEKIWTLIKDNYPNLSSKKYWSE